MPAVNLPNISISNEDFKSQETMEQILDTLMKYRKELNFLLMNLDEENMPVIDEKMDGLYGRMETVDGQVSEFIQTVDGFRMTVSNYEGQVSEFIQTVDGFQTTVSNYEGQVSQFVQTVDGFQTTVANYQGQVSQFTQTVNGFQTQVSNYASEVGTFNSEITQLAESISSKVSYTDYNGREIVSLIEQTASSIKLSANKIDLNGITTVNRSLMLGSGSNYGELIFNNGVSIYASPNSPLGGYAMEFDAEVFRFYGRPIFNNDAIFYGDVDFRGNTTGLSAIESYYSGNKCYIDYGGGSRLTIRDSDGYVVGYVPIE